MKRAALILVLSFLAVITAFAQDKFPDVPENHWTYREVVSHNPVVNYFLNIRVFILYCCNTPWIRNGMLVIVALSLLAVWANLARKSKRMEV